MTYTYRAPGLAYYYGRYVNDLLNRFTENNLQIVSRNIGATRAEIKVSYGGEVGIVVVEPRGYDLVIQFNVRESFQRKSMEIARTGLRFLGTIISGGSPIEATIDTVQESFDSALAGEHGELASIIASAIRDVAEELRMKIEEEARMREEQVGEVKRLMTELESRLITLEEEISLAREEGKDVSRITRRFERAKALFEEARKDRQAGRFSEAKAKLEAASRLLDRAESLLGEIY